MLKPVSNSLIIGTALVLSSWIAAPSLRGDAGDRRQDPRPERTTQDPPAPTLAHYRGVAPPVRASGEQEFTEETKTVSFEAYRDWDFGTVTLVTEAGAIAAVPAPHNWEVRTVAIGSGMVAIAFVPSTGLSWVLTDEGQKQKWEPILERGALDLGDYDVMMSAGIDGITALRFDRYSGRSWSYSGVAWIPLEGNLADWPARSGAESRR